MTFSGSRLWKSLVMNSSCITKSRYVTSIALLRWWRQDEIEKKQSSVKLNPIHVWPRTRRAINLSKSLNWSVLSKTEDHSSALGRLLCSKNFCSENPKQLFFSRTIVSLNCDEKRKWLKIGSHHLSSSLTMPPPPIKLVETVVNNSCNLLINWWLFPARCR